ncbi:MAG: carboxylating nicotinate-nucleotide diphosphorylase [Clostridiales Family XIII bacterium]|jgi:nicotinate-nucleotide pyrophosphorylase (carboxylating)|nr:carboxylating nicotinate-nucleotide diphosphorylase [Clostridiales Family XIII bacterium]
MNYTVVDELIKRAFDEDFPSGDITTEALIGPDLQSRAVLLAKEDGVVAGLEVFQRVFTMLGGVECRLFREDGESVHSGEKIAELTGNTRNLLTGERTALNFVQRMSGVATLTSRCVQALSGSRTKLLDTRKTTPGFRYLEKYAVAVGGGVNHRFGLSDGILIKDNHIKAAGGVARAVEKAKERHGFARKIEVETESLDMVREALDAGADIIMLDNMDIETMKRAVSMIGGRALTECSGNVTPERLRELGDIGVDYISSGALTHSYSSLDLSLRFIDE